MSPKQQFHERTHAYLPFSKELLFPQVLQDQKPKEGKKSSSDMQAGIQRALLQDKPQYLRVFLLPGHNKIKLVLETAFYSDLPFLKHTFTVLGTLLLKATCYTGVNQEIHSIDRNFSQLQPSLHCKHTNVCLR